MEPVQKKQKTFTFGNNIIINIFTTRCASRGGFATGLAHEVFAEAASLADICRGTGN